GRGAYMRPSPGGAHIMQGERFKGPARPPAPLSKARRARRDLARTPDPSAQGGRRTLRPPSHIATALSPARLQRRTERQASEPGASSPTVDITLTISTWRPQIRYFGGRPTCTTM